MISLEQLQAGLVLPIDKPRQWTSFQAVNKVKATIRRLYGLKTFKIGHAGTLDPLATGLLLVCVGKATKTIPQLQDGDKTYTGTMVLGATTPCYDMEQAIDNLYPTAHITPAMIEKGTHNFVGTMMQVPPMFSAVKVDGQRAYEYARRDDPTATIQPKAVKIYQFTIESLSTTDGTEGASEPVADSGTTHLYDKPRCVVPAGLPKVAFRIACGKGTYIRSIARDFGTALGSGAFLASLRREQVGDYTVDHALKLDEVERFLTAGQ